MSQDRGLSNNKINKNYMKVKIKVAQLRLTLCDPMDYTVYGILQVRILESFPSPGDLPNPGIEPRSPTLQAYSSPVEAQRKPHNRNA